MANKLTKRFQTPSMPRLIQSKNHRSKGNKQRLVLTGVLYSFSFLVLSLGLAVCLTKSPVSMAKNYIVMMDHYENLVADSLPHLSHADLATYVKKQEKLIVAAQSLDPTNTAIKKKLSDLTKLKDLIRLPNPLLATSINFDNATSAP